MKKIINEQDLMKANNIEKCQILQAIIRKQVIYKPYIKSY